MEKKVRNDTEEEIDVGNLMIKHAIGREVSQENKLKVIYHPGAFTNDINYYGKTVGRRKPDHVIIHA